MYMDDVIVLHLVRTNKWQEKTAKTDERDPYNSKLVSFFDFGQPPVVTKNTIESQDGDIVLRRLSCCQLRDVGFEAAPGRFELPHDVKDSQAALSRHAEVSWRPTSRRFQALRADLQAILRPARISDGQPDEEQSRGSDNAWERNVVRQTAGAVL